MYLSKIQVGFLLCKKKGILKFMKSFLPFLLIIFVISGVYYKFFIFGKIPFPGDLLIVSYSPWFDYYKFPVQNPLISDVFSQFFLWKHLSLESLRQWQWPLWNPYSFMGTPLLATYHSAVLYPLNILLFLPRHIGWGIYIYLQTAVAALSFYLFASLIIKSKFASIAGALIFSFGGLMTTWLELGTAGHAIAWLPLTLFCISKFADSKKFRFILILILSLSLIILAGNAQITTYSFAILSSYSLWLYFQKKIHLNAIFILFLAMVLSISLTSLQLLPSFDLLQKSIRTGDTYTAENNFGLLDIKDAFKFFIPDYFGSPITRNYWGTLNYSETSGFLGILMLPLLIYFSIKVRSKDAFFFGSLFLFSLLLTFNNPLSFYIYNLKLPLLTSSYASRMLFVTLFSAGIISSLTLKSIWKRRDFFFFQKTILWSWATILGIILGTLLTRFYIQEIIGGTFDKNYLKFYLNDHDFAVVNFSIAARNSLIPFAILTVLLIASLIFNMKVYKPLAKRLLMSIIFILIILDLGRYFLKFNPFVADNLIFPKVPSLEFLEKQKGLFRVGREYAEVLPPNTWTAYKLYSPEGYDPVYLSNYAKFMHFLNGGDLRSGTTGRYAEIAATYKSPYLDASNVKYYITILRDAHGQVPGNLLNYRFKETGYKVVFQDKSSAILENPNAEDRAYFAQNIITTKESDIEKLFMEDKSFNPTKTVALSLDLNLKKVTGQGGVEITEYSPNRVKIKTKTISDEILVLTDQYEDGWKTTIDGNKTSIAPANLIYRAIKVPAGSHEVIFNYWPKSFDIGLKASFISLIFIISISSFTIKFKKF